MNTPPLVPIAPASQFPHPRRPEDEGPTQARSKFWNARLAEVRGHDAQALRRQPERGRRFKETTRPWKPEMVRTIFRAYTLRAVGTGGPLGRGPDCRFTGTGNRSEPALAGYQHFGGSFDEPLKPYRSYPADLTSGP